MKKIILIVLFFGSTLTKGQILNPGFESVTGNKPNNYNQTSDGYGTYFIKDTAVPYTGTRAAYIKGFSNMSYAVQGGVFGIFQTQGKPLALTGWYKCNILPGDSIVFSPYVYASSLVSPNLQAYAYTTTSTAVYKQFTASFNYTGFSSPTVAIIYTGIYLSGQDVDNIGLTIPKTGTWAIIDDLALTFSTTPTPTLNTSVGEYSGNVVVEQIYPQPLTDISLMVYTINETAVVDLFVFDLNGKQVKTIFAGEKQSPGRYKAELDLRDLESGIYFLRLLAGNDIKTLKIVKQ